MNFRRQHSFVAALALLFASLSAAAETRVLLVGDSWAAGMLGFRAFEQALEESGARVSVAGADTAIGGSRADQWAANHDGKLDTLAKALELPVDVVVISLGGNDLLRAALAGRIASPEQREELTKQVARDLGVLLDAIREAAPDATAVLIGYDFLDPERMQETYGMEFPESSVEHLDAALEALEDARDALTMERDRVQFVRNLGLMRATYGPGAADAMPDGVHPTPEAYQVIAGRAWEMLSWLLEMPTAP